MFETTNEFDDAEEGIDDELMALGIVKRRKHPSGILPNHVEPGHEYATLRRALDEGWDI